jgi:uncharacterized protein (DUF2236 family)
VAPAESIPPELEAAAMIGIVPLMMGSSNVVMQLARLPVGRGVAESRVESGRVDRHPIKRLRTTLSFLVIALHGTDEERRLLRHEINRAHRQVRSRPEDPVAYNAFDRDLQLWVAACLYVGIEDAHRWLFGPLEGEARERAYRYCARFGTTLQVPEGMWPADREAFEAYWQEGLAQIEMDAVTRAYLQGFAAYEGFPAIMRRLNGPTHRLMTLGFLPEPFRRELGLPWTARDQRRFDRITGVVRRITLLTPPRLRRFPLNVYLWDVRRRLRNGTRVV